MDSVAHTIPILQDQVDSLKALAIVPSIGWIPANHFPHLTHLYIAFDVSVESPRPQDVLFLLRNAPRLEILHIHRLNDPETILNPESWQLELSVRAELPRLRSLVFTVSAYHLVAHVLRGLSLPPSTLIRLDNLFVFYDSEYPGPIPAGLGALDHITTMELAVQNEMLFLVVESASSGLWLKVRHEKNTFWHRWLLDLHHTLPLTNLVSLRMDVSRYDPGLPVILRHMVQLSELFVRLNNGEDGPGDHAATLPPGRSSSRSWPENMPKSANLGISDIIAMLSTRSRLGHPIRRLIVQAITIGLESIRLASQGFSEQLSSLAEHVEEYEECVDAETHVCGFEMRDMWNVEGAEDYWSVDDKQRPRYTPLWSYEYS
ncbi:hypothetical protein LXA43DRAFT_1186816 [Ganoderma leucocontextum]|nr:hypothetical protein LXA43DRAFT_1186816 [Ganoderma leucocontextum]